jgi:hypothetical protein
MLTVGVMLGWLAALQVAATSSHAQQEQGGIRMLKASPAPPPEAEKMEADLKHAPAPPQKRATVEELEQELLKSPSEREKLQKAKERFKPSSTAPHTSRYSLSWLNPLGSRPRRWQVSRDAGPCAGQQRNV